MITRYIFPIILIAVGIAGVMRPEADFAFFSKLANIVPQSIQFAPMYQMVFGLIGIIGFIGLIEVFVTNKARKRWQNEVAHKTKTGAASQVNYYGNENLPRGASRNYRR